MFPKPKLNGKIFRMGLLTSELHYFPTLLAVGVFFIYILEYINRAKETRGKVLPFFWTLCGKV
jgi:hypothetical protein